MTEPIYDVRSFWELLEKRAAATPDRPMLIDAADRRVTFAEFKAWAERAAAGFHAMGIGEDTVVTWQLPTRIETLVASFALSRLGAIQNPIIQIYREREVGFALAQMRSEFVLVPGVWRNFDYVGMIERLSVRSACATEDRRGVRLVAGGRPVDAAAATGTARERGRRADQVGVLHVRHDL